METFTDPELRAARETKRILRSLRSSEGDLLALSDREIMLCAMVSKLRPEKAADKHKRWLDALQKFGVCSFADLYGELDSEDGWAALAKQMSVFAPCGTDKHQRALMWIRGRPIPPSEELATVRASCIFHLAVHADLHTLRNGVTLVLDTASDDTMLRVGNELKFQRLWQSMPLRPQRFYILGAGPVKRILINALISVVSYVAGGDKIVSRIRFASLNDVLHGVEVEALPEHVGGKAGGFSDAAAHLNWIRERFKSFPAVPEL